MQVPKAGWALYNVFRLVAVVFMIWALVAQFVAVASDLKAYSEAKQEASPASSPAPARATRSTTTLSATQNTERLITAPVSRSTLTTSSIRTSVTTPSTTARRETLTRVIEDTDATTATRPTALITATRVAPAVETDALIVPNKRALRRKAEATEPTSGTYGVGSIPTSPGGVLFAIASRLIMVCALGFLLVAQLGMPETWLYRKTPMFGPQSTPLWLGVGQSVIAVENLRIYSINVVWTAHAGLLVIGMINAHLALILLFVAYRRKLPKDPPPPLYFSRLTRMLYFRPAPPFYSHLLGTEDGQGASDMKPASGRARGLRVEVDDPEMALTRDEAHTDVRRGGYPTFARGGITQPGSQIPVGVLDGAQGGQVNGFTAGPRPPPSLDARSVETGDAYSGVADDESRVDARDLAERNASKDSLTSSRSQRGKRKPAPLGLDQSNATTRAEQQQAERERNIAALREKLSGRMERSGLADKGISTAVLGPPTLQRTTSDQVSSAHTIHTRHRDLAQAGPSINASDPVLPSIPKRSNTLEQPSARTPRTEAAHALKPPAPPPKSPAKSMAGSLYSSILPWTKASRPASPTSPKSRPTQPPPPVPPMGQAMLTVPQGRADAGSTSVEPSQVKPRPQRVDALAGTKGSTDPQPLSRSESGSRLLKKLKDARSRSPTPVAPIAINKTLARADTLPSARTKPTSYGAPNPRQASMSAAIEADSPLSAMIESVRAKVSDTTRGSPPGPRSPSPPVSPPARPKTAQSMFPNPAIRSSIGGLARSGSARSARSAKTAMGVRFDLEKRHSSSDEDLLSPDSQITPTPKSAGFRIPGTKLHIPFPSTPRGRPTSTGTASTTSSEQATRSATNLLLEMKDTDDDLSSLNTAQIEAARPESVATASSTGSIYQQRGLDAFTDGKSGTKPVGQFKTVAERAGLPKRANTIANDAEKMARRSQTVILGGEFIDGGHEMDRKTGHQRRPSSISIDSRAHGGM